MTNIRKEDAPKVFKLVGAIVLVFVMAAWRIANADAPPSTPKEVTISASQPTSDAAPGASVAPASTAGTGTAPAKAAAETAISVPTLDLPADANPFEALNPGPATAPIANAAPPSTISGPLSAAPTPLSVRSVPVAAASAPAEASLRLTGLVPGSHATAVIQVGNKEMVIRKGSRLPNGATVLQIDADSVTLRQGKNQTVLSMEG